MIGEHIKKFRIKKGITQEELGRIVGVTTQAVSKWERGGVPDAELLPNIADALCVTTDMLFGRKNMQNIEDMALDEILSVERQEGFKKAFQILWSMSIGLSKLGSVKESFSFNALDSLKNKEGYHYYSRLSFDEGTVDAKLDADNRYFFIMPEPDEGYAKMFENVDELAETFSLFGNKDILKIIFYMYSRKNTPVSLSLISAKTKIDVGKAEKLMDKLCKCNLADCGIVETENGTLKAYMFRNKTIVIPLLCFAKEIRDEKVINWGVWFERYKPLF